MLERHFYAARMRLPSVLSLTISAAGIVMAGAAVAQTDVSGGSPKGFTGVSIFTATGFQYATVDGIDLRVQGTDTALPSVRETNQGTIWLVGLDYTHVFANQFSLGAQVEYQPSKDQFALSMSPGYAFNKRVMGYFRFGWASVPTTIAQGPGSPSLEKNLNAYFGGIGAKVNLDSGIFVYAEVRYARVERYDFVSSANVSLAPGRSMTVPVQGSANTTAVNTFIGLGYRF